MADPREESPSEPVPAEQIGSCGETGLSRIASSAASSQYRLCQQCRTINAEILTSSDGYRLSVPGPLSGQSLDLDCYVFVTLRLGNTSYGTSLQIKYKPSDRPRRTYSPSNVPQPPYPLTLTGKDDPAVKYGVPVASRDLTNTGSDESFTFIRKCITECQQSHVCMNPLGRTISAPVLMQPSRLINVNQANFLKIGSSGVQPDHVWLESLDTTLGGTVSQYITLSHCWGGRLDSTITTTKESLKARSNSILVSSLPLTFRHAVHITRKLGISYLWIDALCIVQDSAEDWAAESVKMGDIYEGSFLTIAAHLGGSSYSRCFNQQSTSQDRVSESNAGQMLVVESSIQDGKTSTLFFWSPNVDLHEPSPLYGSPLSRRGWTLQERLLSPRTTHYTPTQLVWECREMYETEDGLPYLKVYRDNESPRTLNNLVYIPGNELRSIWYDWIITSEYSRRDFTRLSDRLVAISGIARAIRQHTPHIYLAGLWHYELG